MVVPPQPPWQSRGGARVSQRHKNRAFRRWYLLAFNRDAWFSWGRWSKRREGPMKRNVPWPERGGIPLKGGKEWVNYSERSSSRIGGDGGLVSCGGSSRRSPGPTWRSITTRLGGDGCRPSERR